jgi:hypothetical protein
MDLERECAMLKTQVKKLEEYNNPSQYVRKPGEKLIMLSQ